MIKKIFGMFSGQSNASSEDSLSNLKLIGSLYRKKIGSPKEILSEECSLSFIVVNNQTFEYNLKLTNDDYQFNKELTWETMTFSVANERSFKTCIEDGKDILLWEYNRQFYIFVLLIDEQNTKMRKKFLTTLCDLVTSDEYQEDLATASKKDQQEKTEYVVNYDAIDNVEEFLEENYGNIYGIKEEKPSEPRKIDKDEGNVTIEEITKNLQGLNVTQLSFWKSYPKAEEVFAAKGYLFKYDKENDILVPQTDHGVFKIMKIESFKYFIVVDDETSHDNTTYTATGISQEANIVTNREERLIFWLGTEPDGKVVAFNFLFSDDTTIDTLRKILSKTKYESSSLSKYEDLKEDEREWLENENIPDEESEIQKDKEDVDVDMDLDNHFQESTSERANKLTAQAYLHDRTFVIRDDNTIGVYKTDEDEVLSHLVNLPAVTEYGNKDIDIKNAHMYYSDTNMMLLDKLNPNSAFRYDLGTGKVVEEWTAEKMKNISSIAPETKLGQMTDNQTLVGVNNQNLFIMDGRVNKRDKVVSVKSYKTNPKMNCVMTTDFGGIATGSAVGEIRLYKEVGKNAKTLLPCFGDPIRALDVTSDGKFVLATCDKYLILISTTCKGDKNGFNVQMGKEKPHPKTLKIKPIDINKYQLDKLNFTPARFNVNAIEGETNIITSIGDYVVIWNFAKIKKGILDDYKIKRVNQYVIENQFKYNKNQVVVTMENKLRIQNQMKLFKDSGA